VSAFSHRTIHAVGEYYSGVEERTLIERIALQSSGRPG
jgi:hypothetical protein